MWDALTVTLKITAQPALSQVNSRCIVIMYWVFLLEVLGQLIWPCSRFLRFSWRFTSPVICNLGDAPAVKRYLKN
ncbi:hypothetical protein B0H13DRAFT_2030535 [Mycena leptocephala]|nr:hypothetical protein B0H13DRAFT_2030535 [Mycena leptocephala]